MNIGFMTKWPKKMGPQLEGKPTYFPEKILTSLVRSHDLFDWERYGNEIDSREQHYECTSGPHWPKEHTIRADPKDRWKPGMGIHFYINVRQPSMMQFAPVFDCVSTQSIEIKHSGELWRTPWVFIDGRLLVHYEIATMALNDGFNSVNDFFAWFNEDFKGKIIHWTNLKY